MRRFFYLLGLGAQFAALSANFPVLAVMVVHAAGAGAHIGASVMGMTLLAQGLGTVLMGLRMRWVGPGQPVPLSPTPIYMAASLQAASVGGMPLVFGMTLFSGVVQVIFTPLLRALQHILSTNIGYLVLALIGFDLGYYGLVKLAGLTENGEVGLVWIGIGCFLLIYCIKVWAWPPLSRMAILVSMVVGYLVTYFCGLLSEEARTAISEAPWFEVPQLAIGGWSFSWALAIPFAIAALISTVKVVGAFTALQQIENPEATEPDMVNVGRGNVADAIGTVISGGLGGVGIGLSSSSTAIAVGSKVTNPRVAILTGVILVLVAFVRKVSVVMMLIPPPVLVAMLIFLGITLIQTSIPILAHAMERRRCALYMSVALLLGLTQPVFPALFRDLPEGVRLFTGSATAIACLVALFLRLLALIRRGDEQLAR